MSGSQRIIVVGAGAGSALAIDILGQIRESDGFKYEVLGVLDDSSDKQGTDFEGYPVIGAIEPSLIPPDAMVVIGIGSSNHPHIRLALAHRLGLKLERYLSVIHPSAQISRQARLAPGALVNAGVSISCNADIGPFFYSEANSCISHDCRIKGGVTLGANCSIAGHTEFWEGVYMGQGGSVIQSTTIGSCAIIGMGAVVLNDLPDASTAVGLPARVVKQRLLPASFGPWQDYVKKLEEDYWNGG